MYPDTIFKAVIFIPLNRVQPELVGKNLQTHVKILLAEDNITNQIVAKGVLEKFGYYVDAVANGIEAIHALEKISYDMIKIN